MKWTRAKTLKKVQGQYSGYKRKKKEKEGTLGFREQQQKGEGVVRSQIIEGTPCLLCNEGIEKKMKEKN